MIAYEIVWALLGVVFLALGGAVVLVALRVPKRWYWRGVALLPALLFLFLGVTFLLVAMPGEHVMETGVECFRNGVEYPCPPNTPP